MRYLLAITLLIHALTARAQTSTNSVNVSVSLPSVALIDLLQGTSGNVVLSMTAPTEAGNAAGTGTVNANTWLIFTSAVAAGSSRSIRGDIIGNLPAGIRLKLNVAPYVGNGQGFTGGKSYVTGNTYLTSTPTRFIDNIQGAYTGTGYGTSGFRLTYSLEVQNFANIRSGSSTVTVRYTMSDN
jgi:hypothetical protein